MSDFEARARTVIAEAEQRRERRGRLRQILIIAAPFCALIMFVSVTEKKVEDDPMGAVSAARLWTESGPASYQVTYVRHGSEVGTIGPATVAVVEGEVTSYDTDDPRLEDAVILSVDRMLLTIEEMAVDPTIDVLVAKYDPVLGYPTVATFARGPSGADTWGFRVLELTSLDP